MHQLAMLRERLEPATAALAVSATAAGSIVARLLVSRFADRWDKRRLIVVTQVITAGLLLVLATLTLLKMVEVWHALTIAFLVGAVEAFDQAARRALFPHSGNMPGSDGRRLRVDGLLRSFRNRGQRAGSRLSGTPAGPPAGLSHLLPHGQREKRCERLLYRGHSVS